MADIAIIGIARGQEPRPLLLGCISTAIASIPVGLPTFVQAMLSYGARRLAESKAVVKTLTDVETLGGTTVINSDKTGTLTMNAMTATSMLTGGDWYTIEGGGYQKTGAILGVGLATSRTSDAWPYGLTCLCTDATVADDEWVIGDPTEAALVVLAAQDRRRRRADPAAPSRDGPKCPSTSEYKFMATLHDRADWLTAGVLHELHFVSGQGRPRRKAQR